MANHTLLLNQVIINQMAQAQYIAALKTGNSILVDISADETVPFDTSLLENSGHVNQTREGAEIQYSTPYAAKQYFDASLDHSKGPHAGTAKDHWMDTYLEHGAKEDFPVDKFKRHYTNELRRIF